jgi:large subunit ribosomal protein L29
MKENADRARGLDAAEINKELREGAEQLFRLRFQMAMGQMDGVKKLRALKKERARMLTVLRERELPAAAAAGAPAVAKPAKAKKPVAKAKPVVETKRAAKAVKVKPAAEAKPKVKAQAAAKKASPKTAAKPKAEKKTGKSKKG